MNDIVNETPEWVRRSPDPGRIARLLGPKTILDTQRAGWQSAVRGEHVRACPYRGPDERAAGLRAMWLRGYAAGRTDLRTARTGPPAAVSDVDTRRSPEDASPPETS